MAELDRTWHHLCNAYSLSVVANAPLPLHRGVGVPVRGRQDVADLPGDWRVGARVVHRFALPTHLYATTWLDGERAHQYVHWD